MAQATELRHLLGRFRLRESGMEQGGMRPQLPGGAMEEEYEADYQEREAQEPGPRQPQNSDDFAAW
jgi:hypothetical protein